MKEKVDKKIKQKKIKLTTVTLILLLAVFLIVVTQTSTFNVAKIVVEGNKEVSADKIKLISAIVIGENIFKLDIKNAKENLLLHTYVEDVDIKRKFPDQIMINITEREEIACIKHMNEYVYIGVNGLVLDVLKEKKENKVPLVVGVTIENPSVGSEIVYKRKDQKENAQINKMLETLALKGMKAQTEKILFNGKNIDIILLSGVNIAFGPPYNIEYKMTFGLNALK